MTNELRQAMRYHRMARDYVFNLQRYAEEMAGDTDIPMIAGDILDTAHLDHWHALQEAGVSATRAGQLCAAISRTRLPR